MTTTSHGPPAAPGRIPLLYLLAASHSGSTLLAMLLGSHPEMCTAGELKATALGAPEAYRCSCGRLIGECPFWTDIRSQMAARGFDFDITRAGTDLRHGASPVARRLLRPLHRGPALEAVRDAALACTPGWRAHLARVQALNAALAASVLERSGARVVVDSSKIGIRLKYLLRNPAFDVKVVRLVRDGRAVSLTYMDPERFADARDPRLRGGGTGASRAQERLPVERAAREWRRSNEEGRALVAGLPREQWMELRYEALCADPAGTLDRVHAFAGVAPLGRVPDFRACEHHVVGNGMRLDTTTEIRLDDRWTTALGRDDLQAFESEAGPLNRELGYA